VFNYKGPSLLGLFFYNETVFQRQILVFPSYNGYISSAMNDSMDRVINNRPRVAIATGKTRKDTVAQALDLVRDDISNALKGDVLIKPNFLSSTRHLASTQAEAVEPVLDLLSGYTGGEIVIGEGGSRSTSEAFDRFGYRDLELRYGVNLRDLNRDGYMKSFELVTETGGIHAIRYSDTAAEAGTIISVAVAKTHDTATVTLSLKNMMGCLKRVERPRMHGIQLGSTAENAIDMLWKAIERHDNVIKLISGIVFFVVHAARSVERSISRGEQPGLFNQVKAMSENLARLATVLKPAVSVIDAFDAMEGNGPGGGKPVPMRCAVAGTDAIACDAVMAYMMGFDPMRIGYLALAHERGLGVADISQIEVTGENPAALRRRFISHENYPVQSRWYENRSAVTVP